ncbi:hypothetical protein [Pedobacter sp. Leaf194]|uniref:hypothetical protein n=1 Tax=Pedobacter sp. Leaf194 TaxID=1736297 RepID=UPI000703A547|nr:hypothetical protein [Pedobacter sp. Leaf194]KQS35959.1 hypothetical protein ASG14_10950 [Pedobacter sp. Leaf194]
MFKIIGINLLAFAAYALLIVHTSTVADRGFSIAVGMGVCIFLHVVLNLVAAIIFLVLGKKEFVKSFFISAAVLAPVGFVTWLILLSIYG